MKFYKRKWFWAIIIIVILVVAGVSYAIVAGKNANATVYTTEDVKKGDITQTVSATGVVQSAHEIDMNFKGVGKITTISVKEGDSVKAGQVLAKIEDSTSQTAVKQARAGVSSAQANLAKIQAGASAEDISLTQEQLNKAISDLESLRSDSRLQIDNLRNSNIDSLNSSAIVAQVALDKIYGYLLDKDTTYNLYFTNSDLFNQVNDLYAQLKIKLTNVKKDISNAQSQRTDTSINQASDEMEALMAEINSFLNSSFDLATAIITNVDYPQSEKDGIKTNINAQVTAVNSSLSSLQAADSGLTNSSSSFDTQIKAAQNNVSIVTAQLALKRAGARNFDIQSAQASVAQAQATLEGALNNLKDYVISAPIDGKVVAVNYTVGEQPNASQPVIKMLSNEKFEIKVDIPESDIAKVKLADKVAIDLDAFGSDKIFNGTITSIDPAQTVIQDVVYYKTTITFDDAGLESQIKPGMTANVTITTAQKQAVLYVPQRAVKIKASTLDQQQNEKYVEVLTAPNTTQEKIVTIGLKADGGMVEILSGLNEGEKVVTFTKTGK